MYAAALRGFTGRKLPFNTLISVSDTNKTSTADL